MTGNQSDLDQPKDLQAAMGALSTAASDAAKVFEEYFASRKPSKTSGLFISALRKASCSAYEATTPELIREKFKGSSGTGSTRRGVLYIAHRMAGLLIQSATIPEGSESDTAATLSQTGLQKLRNQLALGLTAIGHHVPDWEKDRRYKPDYHMIKGLAASLTSLLTKQNKHDNIPPFDRQKIASILSGHDKTTLNR